MRRPILAVTIAAASASLAACGIHRAEHAGPDITRAFPVGNFTSIEVAGPYEVHVHTGATPGVTVKGPQNILDHMVVEVDGSKLAIHSKNSGMWGGIHWSSHSPVTVEVVTPALDGAIIAGSGDIAVDQITGAAFKGAVAGSGSLTLAALDVQKLKLEIAGSGDIAGAGKANDAEYESVGSGSVNAPKIVTQTLKVSIAGSGNVTAQSSGTAELKIMGSGDVTVTGGAKCSVSKMGSGSAHCS